MSQWVHFFLFLLFGCFSVLSWMHVNCTSTSMWDKGHHFDRFPECNGKQLQNNILAELPNHLVSLCIWRTWTFGKPVARCLWIQCSKNPCWQGREKNTSKSKFQTKDSTKVKVVVQYFTELLKEWSNTQSSTWAHFRGKMFQICWFCFLPICLFKEWLLPGTTATPSIALRFKSSPDRLGLLGWECMVEEGGGVVPGAS